MYHIDISCRIVVLFCSFFYSCTYFIITTGVRFTERDLGITQNCLLHVYMYVYLKCCTRTVFNKPSRDAVLFVLSFLHTRIVRWVFCKHLCFCGQWHCRKSSICTNKRALIEIYDFVLRPSYRDTFLKLCSHMVNKVWQFPSMKQSQIVITFKISISLFWLILQRISAV